MLDGEKPPKLLTLRRRADGRLIPFVDDCPVMGCIDVVCETNDGQQVAHVTFHTSMVVFDTAKNQSAHKMN
jgi:hypothetical protein